MNLKSETFCQACLNGELDTVRSHLKDDPDLANAFGQVHPNHREFMSKENADAGWSALHLAAHYGRLDIVKAHIAAGAHLNAKARNGICNTPLMSAVAGSQIEIVKYLLEQGADVNQTDKENFTAEALAEVEGKPEIALLIRNFKLGNHLTHSRS